MAEKKKNWLLIVLGIVIFVVIVGIAAVVGFGFWMYRQMGVTTLDTRDPDPAFEEARAPFKGQMPYIELSTDNQEEKAVVHHELEKTEKTPLNRLRIVAYDPGKGQLVRLQLPFWIVRLGGSGHTFRLHAANTPFASGMELSVTPDDLERRGPGLILDQKLRDGVRVLVWSE
jgi:hypothetical protein